MQGAYPQIRMRDADETTTNLHKMELTQSHQKQCDTQQLWCLRKASLWCFSTDAVSVRKLLISSDRGNHQRGARSDADKPQTAGS